MENRKCDGQKPRQHNGQEEQEREKDGDGLPGAGVGKCNQSLLNAARLAGAVARATIKHFSCNKLKLKASKKTNERRVKKGQGGGGKPLTAAWHKHHVHHVVCALLFCLLCA